MPDTATVPTWRRVLAFILDLITAFFAFGFLIASVTGGRTETGFELTGAPALILFACVIAYFLLFGRYAGGTIWQHILRARRR